MRPVTMECPACSVQVHGTFRQTLFQLLTSEEQELLEQYLLSDFSIKDLATRTGMGYTALRTRLDALIARYRSLADAESARKQILDRVANGSLNASKAAEMLNQLKVK